MVLLGKLQNYTFAAELGSCVEDLGTASLQTCAGLGQSCYFGYLVL